MSTFFKYNTKVLEHVGCGLVTAYVGCGLVTAGTDFSPRFCALLFYYGLIGARLYLRNLALFAPFCSTCNSRRFIELCFWMALHGFLGFAVTLSQDDRCMASWH